MDKIFDRKQLDVLNDPPSPPHFNVDSGREIIWTKYSICRMPPPSTHHNIEIGGGGEAVPVLGIISIEYFVHLPSRGFVNVNFSCSLLINIRGVIYDHVWDRT